MGSNLGTTVASGVTGIDCSNAAFSDAEALNDCNGQVSGATLISGCLQATVTKACAANPFSTATDGIDCISDRSLDTVRNEACISAAGEQYDCTLTATRACMDDPNGKYCPEDMANSPCLSDPFDFSCYENDTYAPARYMACNTDPIAAEITSNTAFADKTTLAQNCLDAIVEECSYDETEQFTNDFCQIGTLYDADRGRLCLYGYTPANAGDTVVIPTECASNMSYVAAFCSANPFDTADDCEVADYDDERTTACLLNPTTADNNTPGRCVELVKSFCADETSSNGANPFDAGCVNATGNLNTRVRLCSAGNMHSTCVSVLATNCPEGAGRNAECPTVIVEGPNCTAEGETPDPFNADCTGSTNADLRAMICRTRATASLPANFDASTDCTTSAVQTAVCADSGANANPFDTVICADAGDQATNQLNFVNNCDAGEPAKDGATCSVDITDCLDNLFGTGCDAPQYATVRTTFCTVTDIFNEGCASADGLTQPVVGTNRAREMACAVNGGASNEDCADTVLRICGSEVGQLDAPFNSACLRTKTDGSYVYEAYVVARGEACFDEYFSPLTGTCGDEDTGTYIKAYCATDAGNTNVTHCPKKYAGANPVAADAKADVATLTAKALNAEGTGLLTGTDETAATAFIADGAANTATDDEGASVDDDASNFIVGGATALNLGDAVTANSDIPADRNLTLRDTNDGFAIR